MTPVAEIRRRRRGGRGRDHDRATPEPSGEWRQRHHQVRRSPSPCGTVLPGLVDIHCHGGGGKRRDDDRCRRSRSRSCSTMRSTARTSLVASLVTAHARVLLDQVRALACALVAELVSSPVCISKARSCRPRAAAHSLPEFLTATRHRTWPTSCWLSGDGAIKVMTLAPGADPAAPDVATRLCAGRGDGGAGAQRRLVHRCSGRRCAHLDGLGLVTHLGNGMPAFHHRSVGPVGACARGGGGWTRRRRGHRRRRARRSPDSSRWCSRSLLTGSVVLVTDAMAAAGMS
ncbi:MAG: hypothetical protein WKF83_05695 [Nocardioidaceae bacterium]